MKHEHKIAALCACAAVGLLAFYMEHRKKSAALSVADSPASDNTGGSVDAGAAFLAPFQTTVPGIPDTASGFSSPINVTVNADTAAMLTNKYIPLFGFVGMAGSGSGFGGH